MKLVGIVASALLVALAGCPNETRNDSIRALNQCNKEYGQKQFDSAIASCKRAVEQWADNHTAWYSLGGAYAQKRMWNEAADAMNHAVQLVPDQGMYQLHFGRFLYE